MADLRCLSSSALDGMQLRSLHPQIDYTRTRTRNNHSCHGVVDMANGQVVLVTTNIEAVIGQLYPATLLARLVTLELKSRHDA